MRISKKFILHFLSAMIIILLICPATSIAQQCGCPEYAVLKADYESKDAESKPYIEKLQSSANKICNAKAFEWLGNDHLSNKNFDTAEIYFQKAEELYKSSNCGDSIVLSIYKRWADLNYTKGDFAKAQEYSFKVLHAAEASGSASETATAYTMIAQLLNQTGQADKGIVYSRKAVSYLKNITDPSSLADILFKLSKRYLWHYQDTKTESSLDSSELFSMQQLAIARKSSNNNSIAKAFSNLEGVAWEKEDYQKALQYLDSSFRYVDADDYATFATNYFDKADLYIELKNYTEAERMADSAMYYHKKGGNVAYIAEVYELMSRIAIAKGDYKKAFETKELGRVISDSIRNVEKTKQVSELEKKYNQAKNEKTIEELAQQKRIYFLLALAGLLLLIALAFFIRQQSLKNKQRILEAEQRLNRARMNPHFFFNALASLQSFALRENDGKALAGNLSKFSHIMRETLESTYKDYVTIEQEIDFLNEYLELQKMRFPQKFTYTISAANDLEPHELLIPSMILQPFAENSIEHGFSGIDYAGHLQINFSKTENEIMITITDNGAGFAAVQKNAEGHISRASQIIKDRIYLLNIKLKSKARFSIDNHPSGKGIQVQIYLPIILQDESTGNR